MRKTSIVLVLTLLFISSLSAQKASIHKITPDLVQEMDQSVKADERFQVIIVMTEQLDALSTNQKTQYLSKEQQRKVVENDLKQLSRNGQAEILKDLDQGQKAELVGDIQSFWIVNAISCSATKDMVYSLANRSDVKYVMKDLEIHAIDDEDAEPIQNRTSNHWNIEMVNADDVWALGYTGTGVIVAVIDSGVNYNHYDIVNNMWDGGDDYPNHGWDFVNNDNDPMDDHGHGTHCAGTVASTASSSTQYGIAKDAKIMALKVLSETGSGSKSFSWAAIQFAISHGADILSMSLGTDGKGGFWVEREIMEHVLQCGVVASVAAGNVGNKYTDGVLTYPVPNNVGAPGNCPPPWHNPDQTLEGGRSAVICVGATTSADEHSSFSSFGPVTWNEGNNIGFYDDYPWEEGSMTNIGLIRPDISAPGSQITSLDYSNNSGYTTKSGTSMATPCAAGVMALMLSVNPELTPTEVDSIIETTATPLGGQTSKSNITGAGRIDVLAAVNYMLSACNAPTGLVANESHARVVLNWEAAANVNTYRVYRNGIIIAHDVAALTYTDENAPAGNNTYYVRSNGSNNQASIPSNRVSINVTTNTMANTPDNLIITAINTDDNNVSLSWEAPEIRTGSLYYTNEETTYFGTDEEAFVAAQNYPPSALQAYAGMELNDIRFTVQNSDITCTVKIYEGDVLQPGTLIHSGTVTTTESEQTITYTLDTPLAINPKKNLWITVTLSDYLLVGGCDIHESNDGFLFRYETEGYWSSQPGYAWNFQMGLSDGAYTYNVYCNNTAISTGQSNTSYSGVFSNPMNTYHVTAVTNNYESPISNTVYLAQDISIDNLTLANDEQLVVASGSTLTISGTLSNDDAANLVIEDGAQLIHHNDGVKATVKKGIEGYGETEGGWYTIAAPFANFKADQIAIDNYDLYLYDEDATAEWINYKTHQEDFPTTLTSGYLYAHQVTGPVDMTGTLNSGDYTETVNLSYANSNANIKGYNLLGNPTAHDITFTKTDDVADGYYYLANSNNWVYQTGNTVPSGRGFLVKANASNQSVTLNPQSKENRDREQYISLSIDDQKTYIKLTDGVSMPLLSFKGRQSNVYLSRNGASYIMLVRDEAETIDLCYRPADGPHTLRVTLEDAELDYLHLVDHLTGADIDLLQSPCYSFESSGSDYPTRFQLLFSEHADSSHNFNGVEFVEGKSQILDLTGRVVATDRNTHLAPGVYIVRTTNGNEVKTEKIVVN